MYYNIKYIIKLNVIINIRCHGHFYQRLSTINRKIGV